MSWWDTSSFSSFATQALKNAQKKIDKVLDINEDGAVVETSSVSENKVAKSSEEPKNVKDTGSSWSSWGSFSLDKGKDESEEDTRSAWSMPWGMDTSLTKPKKEKSQLDQSSAASTVKKTESSPVNPKPGGLSSKSKKGALKLKSSVQNEQTENKGAEENVEEKSKLESQNVESVKESDLLETTEDIKVQEKEVCEDENNEKEMNNDTLKSVSDEIINRDKVTDVAIINQESAEKSICSEDNKRSSLTELEQESSDSEPPLSSVSEPEGGSSELIVSEQSHKETPQSPSQVIHSDFKENIAITEVKREGEESIVKEDNLVECIQDQEQWRVDEGTEEQIQNKVESQQEEEAIEVQTKEVEEGEMMEKVDEGTAVGEEGTLVCERENDVNIPVGFDSLAEVNRSQPVDIPSNSPDIDQERLSGLPLSPSTASSLGGTDSDTNKLDSSLDTYTSDETVIEKSSTKMTKSDESIPEDYIPEKVPESSENQDVEPSENMGEISPSSSYVKCMIEDAMDDSAKMEDNGSDTPSKSECSRSTGGHDSGDEISTTTSSDIEIISHVSTPTSNGDGSKMVDLSPLKISLQKTARRGSSPTHRRSDSQSSSSTHSREGQFEQLSPGRDYQDEDDHRGNQHMHEGGKHDLFPLSEHFENDQQQKLIKKIAELTEILQARESKLVQMSKDNNDLMETSNILRNQIQQLEELKEAESEDVNNVTSEFTKRLSEAEKKINQVIREKETVKKQLQDTQDELAKKTKEKSCQIQEKDQQIKELLQEGEKLSKQQLQSNNIIKKLRAKEKENDSLITSQKKKLEDQKTELEHLRKVCEVKDDLEKKQTEAINQLNTAVQKQEREKSKLKSDLEDAQERVRGLQTALDNSYKEIAELHRSSAAQDSKAAETALSLEMQVREELKSQLEQERKSNQQEKEALINQIEDLRMTVSRMEKEHNRREDMLRQEISDLQRHLQEDEARNQDLTQNVTSATRPLLRQIENLQSTYAAQSLSWEKLEKNLSDRLVENQTQLAMVTEKERSANEKVMELSTQVSSLESQNSRLRQEKAQQTAQTEMLKTRVQVLEDAKHSESVQIEAVKQQMSQEMSDLRKEKVFLETQLDMEKNKVEQERKKLTLAQEQISLMEKDLQRPQSRGSVSPLSVSRSESVTGDHGSMSISFSQDDLERSLVMSPVSSRSTLYESIRQGGGAANLIDSLQSQLKQRDGEIFQLKSDIQQLERTRESMARELVNLTNQNEEIHEKIEELPQLKKQYEDLNQRYDALLQMYGEKVEEADELRLDLQDVKEMYKLQIDHLLAK
ncbi:TATA element modulatory factor-like isoform X2 [Saccostrea echinata]|uniref:TATA element modulatory factor-like isoform X2 n=1 Tax=Saccostrea echinata TaxID=191078 RepID=UPI002A80C8E3|nr:TATA element modulatory factor-like isoform X2 [Saccostrea echinata]